MMNVQQAYNAWSETYDAVENKTRDLEARAIRETVSGENLEILEIGCGTGKNTEFLRRLAKSLIGADFSAEMLERARRKITAPNVEFRRLDLREAWDFPDDSFDLVTCSLALEHIENIDFVFAEANRVLRTGGGFYFGELHPFKQYQGSKARFETGAGVFELECFVHHVSEFFAAAVRHDFGVARLAEWFDDDDRTQVPRLLTMVLKKQ
ncbi:MAG TPA: class I SAM-dependent methyltransferase [Pyrinomonadaceae bacterium]|jgi:ubiquinone/menaquinone biosynthesis C-methylase UbiE